jgi:hypothetical protein
VGVSDEEYPEWGFQGENFNVGISNVRILCFRVEVGLPTVAGSNVEYHMWDYQVWQCQVWAYQVWGFQMW